MNEDKLRNLVRWNSTDAMAVLDQTRERVQDAIKNDEPVGVVVCLVRVVEGGNLYEPAFSTLPVEVAFWAAKAIAKKIEEIK